MRAEKQQDGKVATVFLPLPCLTSGASHPHPVMGPGNRQEMGLVDPKATLYVVFPPTPNQRKYRRKSSFQGYLTTQALGNQDLPLLLRYLR